MPPAAGDWIKSAANSFEIPGKKLGIAGYDSTGTQLSRLAEALGMQVLFYITKSCSHMSNYTIHVQRPNPAMHRTWLEHLAIAISAPLLQQLIFRAEN